MGTGDAVRTVSGRFDAGEAAAGIERYAQGRRR